MSDHQHKPAHTSETSAIFKTKRWAMLAGLSVVAAAGLVACGGGEGAAVETTPITQILRVHTYGDSLADVGTFGFKFTVQNAANPAAGYPIFPEIIASKWPIARQCNYYAFNGTTYTARTTSGCTNYAIGGGRIIVPAASGGAANPQTVNTQMVAGAAAIGGTYNAGDLILVDGGGNDAADLVGAYLGAGTPAGLAAYQAVLATQLDAATIGSLLPQANGAALAAGAFMTRLADTFYTQIFAQTVGKGANRVVVLNMPDITLTPRFQAVLAGVAAQAGAAQSAALKAAIQQWIQAFNAQLKTRIGTEPKFALVDFYADFTDQVTNPAKYGFTNATRTVCPVVGTDSSGLPSYNIPACTDAALTATPPPTGFTGSNWWQTWAFSDSFHPTPKGHQLMADNITKVMDAKGWK